MQPKADRCVAVRDIRSKTEAGCLRHRPNSTILCNVGALCLDVSCLIAPCSIVLCFAATSRAADDRPNILFIMTDDHACQAIGAYGSKLIQTPNIDRICSEGLRFDRCYVTNSICGPSRACVLTGMYRYKNDYHINDQESNLSQTTFPALLGRAGYQTALIGKWHLGRQSKPEMFEYWNILEHQGYYYQPKWVNSLGQSQHVGYATDHITQYTLDWLKSGRDPKRPFLLMMQHKAPHRPWDPGPNHLAEPDRQYAEPDTLFDDYANRSSAAAKAEMRIGDHMNVEGPGLKAWDTDSENSAREWFYGKMTRDQLFAWKDDYKKRNARTMSNT